MRQIAKWWLFSGILAGICVFSGCDVKNMTSLKDVSKPYVGEYKCRELKLGGEDRLKDYESVKIEFSPEGKFHFRAVDVNGGESEYEGEYEFSKEEVSLYADAGGTRERYRFRYQDGAVEMRLLFREKLLFARFSMVE